MNEKEFEVFLHRLQTQSTQAEVFAGKVRQLLNLMDEGDMDDAFGTEGWRSRVFSGEQS